MTLPNRDANSSDPITQPYGSDRSSANLFRVSAWLTWRLTDPDLDQHMRRLIELEASEAKAQAQLNRALETMPGNTLEEKLSSPGQRDTLRRLSLNWMRTQRALIDATSAHLEHRAPSNGH